MIKTQFNKFPIILCGNKIKTLNLFQYFKTMTPDNSENNSRPPTPKDEDCCGNGCDPCIFDVHKKLLAEWEKKKLNRLEIPLEKNCLSPIRYNEFIVRDILETSVDSITVQLGCKSGNDGVLLISPCQYVMIKLGSISRPYTPIFWNQRCMKLLIKLYPGKKSSDFFKSMKVGDDLLIRGPYGEFSYHRNSYKHIVIFSIGSGIAAIYALAVSIVEDSLEDTKINMILGFRSFLHVPFTTEIRNLTDYWNFECTLCLATKEAANLTGVTIVNNKLNDEIINDVLKSYSSESTLVLICGTTEFNEGVEKIIKEKKFSHYHVFQ